MADEHDIRVAAAFDNFITVMMRRWREWEAGAPENARLKAIAIKISGLGEPWIETPVCTGVPQHVGHNGMRPVAQHYTLIPIGEICPAWALWLDTARDALAAIKETNDG